MKRTPLKRKSTLKAKTPLKSYTKLKAYTKLTAKTELKQVSKKHAKKERNRKSIFTTDFNECIECHKTSEKIKIDKHEVFGGAYRQTSIKWDMIIPLCRCCHDDEKIEKKWEKIGQQTFMDYYNMNEEEFIKIFGWNYLS